MASASSVISKPIFASNETTVEKPKNEVLVPQILNRETMEEVIKGIEAVPAELKNSIQLNFEKCKRIDSSGARALGELAEKYKESKLSIIKIATTPYKALKLSGRIDGFRLPHQGEIPTKG